MPTTSNYLNFDLQIEPAPPGGYRVVLLHSPAGTAQNAFTLPFSELEIENFLLKIGQPRRNVRGAQSPQIEAAQIFGQRLFEQIFIGDLESALRASQTAALQANTGLRLRLNLAQTPELADLPWEYLYDPQRAAFFSLSANTPLIRQLNLPYPIVPIAIQLPLRVLVLIASPNDYPPLQVDRERDNLLQALQPLQANGILQVDFLEKATLVALQRQLRQAEYHVFHFIGHGLFDERHQAGALLFEDEQGKGHSVNSQQLGTLLHDERALRLAVLNACEGARAARNDPFGGAAQTLVQKGVPAVIAMQFEVTDQCAIIFAHEFYSALADSFPVDAALAEARKAVYAKLNNAEFGTPVLYTSLSDAHAFEITPLSEENRAGANALRATPQDNAASPQAPAQSSGATQASSALAQPNVINTNNAAEPSTLPPFASFPQRLAAGLLDLMLLFVLMIMPGSIAAYLLEPYETALPFLPSLFALFFFSGYAAYYIFFWGRGGQTPMQWLFGLKVIRTDGKPLDWLTAFRRWIAFTFVNLTIIGFFSILVHPQRQAWYDRIVGTYVVVVAKK